ncbi:Unconventional myosin-Ia [Orchesella cincta]|uniref:Unconventional myosin-Ia n=1 Tax=Orchesella cincta TaxID=48709 RepID=A0A1D2MAW6_ORCCI|nr:Unconventional myosin-Ia [Orchesella cincta]
MELLLEQERRFSPVLASQMWRHATPSESTLYRQCQFTAATLLICFSAASPPPLTFIHHHQPPRPPSTTSSGSLSTGFPSDDLQDEGIPTSGEAFTFHPAHHHQHHHHQVHQLQFHRHASPHFHPPQHHFVNPQPHPAHHLASTSSPAGFGGEFGAGGSRAASRATYHEGEDTGGGEEDNLLLDNSVGVQDAAYLDPVTTDNFLTNIVQRFKRDFIYTYVGEGTLLMSVNPYKPLSIFSPRVKAAYRNISNPFQLPPHIYGQLCLILQRNTSSLERTQTLLLTGESGSGKSTNLSYLLDFLVTKQEPRSRRPSSSRGYNQSTGSLHRQHACPYSTGGSCSGRASSLSLTASATPIPPPPVQLQNTNMALSLLPRQLSPQCFWQLQNNERGSGGEPLFERNFHIFYILLVGADSSTLKSLKLTRNAETYAMLNVKNHSSFLNASKLTPPLRFALHDHYYHLRGFKHGYEGCFQLVKTTLASVLAGNTSITPDHVLRMLAAILKLNNLVFAPLTASESSCLRNSLTVTLYTRLFSWLTKQVSFTQKSSSTKPNLLNIIDFYGFEVFQSNSIEQFLINFTNEKIQFVLADLRLRQLQEEFVKDGLEWITIDTSLSTPSPASSSPPGSGSPGKLIDLVEENCHGILSIFANCANDADLERQFQRRFSPPSEKELPPSPGPHHKSTSTSSSSPFVEYLSQSFRLRHWAGPVTYSTRHFAAKNRDTLPPHLPHQLYSWTGDPLLRSLFSHDGRVPTPQTPSSKLLATSNMELSLKNLFQKTNTKHIYYIRCLKPNELSQPEVCESALLKHQVKYHRLIDFVRVYREGFTYNFGAFEFLERYKLLSLNTWPNWRLSSDPKLAIQVLMKDLQMKEGLDFCFGGGSSVSNVGDNLKVYVKGQRIVSELEDFRRERLDDLALLIQKTYRGYRDWRRFRRMGNAVNCICRAWKNYLLTKRKEQRKLWKVMKHSVKVIQAHYILWKRRLFLRQLILQVRAELHLMSSLGGGKWGGPGLPGLGMVVGGVGIRARTACSAPFAEIGLIHRATWRRLAFNSDVSFIDGGGNGQIFKGCRLYRSRFNEIEIAKMKEKVTASMLFKDKKTSYSRRFVKPSILHPFFSNECISHPFLGDYIRLRQNSQWRRTIMMMMLQQAAQLQAQVAPIPPLPPQIASTTEESSPPCEELPKKPLLPSQQLQIVFADLINKITRSSGKFLPIVLVVTTTSIMILDPRTLNIKYKIPATEVLRLSVSPFADDICVLHLQQPMRVGGSVMGPGEQGNLFGGAGGILSDDDDAYYQFGEEPSPTQTNFGGGGCVCSSSNPGLAYYPEQQAPSQQHQCQPGSGGCGLFGGGGDCDSGHYAISEVVKLTKGDLVLHTYHLIEMVTKIFLVVKNATGRGPEVVINNEFPAVFNNQRIQLYFRYSKASQNRSSSSNKTPHEQESSSENPQSRAHLSRSPPPNLLPDGGVPSSIPPKDEPVIPPSQIKITRKKSTRMEFLIGSSSGHS